MSVHGRELSTSLNSEPSENSRGVEDLRENKSFWETLRDHPAKISILANFKDYMRRDLWPHRLGAYEPRVSYFNISWITHRFDRIKIVLKFLSAVKSTFVLLVNTSRLNVRLRQMYLEYCASTPSSNIIDERIMCKTTWNMIPSYADSHWRFSRISLHSPSRIGLVRIWLPQWRQRIRHRSSAKG